MAKKETWWKTYDYKLGLTFILGKKFDSKEQAIVYAKSCGMIILPQSTHRITDEEYSNAILKNENKALRNEIAIMRKCSMNT